MIYTDYLNHLNNTNDILLHSVPVLYYVGMMQLPTLLSCLHSLYWIDLFGYDKI